MYIYFFFWSGPKEPTEPNYNRAIAPELVFIPTKPAKCEQTLILLKWSSRFFEEPMTESFFLGNPKWFF